MVSSMHYIRTPETQTYVSFILRQAIFWIQACQKWQVHLYTFNMYDLGQSFREVTYFKIPIDYHIKNWK